jgi:hypothetical protein
MDEMIRAGQGLREADLLPPAPVAELQRRADHLRRRRRATRSGLVLAGLVVLSSAGLAWRADTDSSRVETNLPPAAESDLSEARPAPTTSVAPPPPATASTTLPQSTTVPSTTAPVTTAPPVAQGPCTARDLTVVQADAEGATGLTLYFIELRNDSATPCSIDGYPVFTFRYANGKPLPFELSHDKGQFAGPNPPVPFVVAPGGSAFTIVEKYRCDLLATPDDAAASVSFELPDAGGEIALEPIPAAISYCRAPDDAPGRILVVSPLGPSIDSLDRHR